MSIGSLRNFSPIFILSLLLLAACAPIQAPAVAGPTATPPAPVLAQAEIADIAVDGAVPLAGEWRFKKVKIFNPDMTAAAFDDSSWATVQAPARWEAQGLGDQVGGSAVVVYRRTVEIPAEWAGQPIGISAWFNPYGTQVFVNGAKVEPLRTPFAPYGDITALVEPGKPATVAAVTLYDGLLDYTDAAPARLGPLAARPVTAITYTEGQFATPDGDAAYTLVHPASDAQLPGLLLVATGSHGLAEVTGWLDTAADLARSGYVAMILALPTQTPAGIQAGLEHLVTQPGVNPERRFVFAIDQPVVAALEAASRAPALRGVIALSPPMLQELPDLSDRPLLLLAAQGDRGGLILNQLQQLAEPLGAQAQVVALPGEGHGTFVLTNTWNAVRDAVLAWLATQAAQPSRPE